MMSQKQPIELPENTKRPSPPPKPPRKLPEVCTHTPMPECKPPKDSEACVFDALKENNELKKRVAKLEMEMEALNERVEKLYLAGKSF